MRIGARFDEKQLNHTLPRVELYKTWSDGQSNASLYLLTADECRQLAEELTTAAAKCDTADKTRLLEKEAQLTARGKELNTQITEVRRRLVEMREVRELRERAK